MKLYATTTSERASKGQGGNKFIKTTYNVGSSADSSPIANIELRTVDGITFTLEVYDYYNKKVATITRTKGKTCGHAWYGSYPCPNCPQTKGNNQKSEAKQCDNCGSTHGKNNSSGEFQCDNCGHSEGE